MAAVQASPMLRILAIIAVHGRVDVGVVEDDERRVAAQLHRDPLSLSADCRRITLPTAVDPVKLTLRSRSSAIKALLSDLESLVVTMLRTPAGRPTSSSVAASASIVSGVARRA